MKHLLTAILLLAFAHTAAGERNVSLERDFGTLYGTLLTPDAGAETVAVIIAGSGPIPRNGSVNNYLYLAQALEKAGIASLRYDKRGIGASRFTEPEKMADAVLGDFIGSKPRKSPPSFRWPAPATRSTRYSSCNWPHNSCPTT